MKSLHEKFLYGVAYICLFGGIFVAFILSIDILESGAEMCVPQAFAYFLFISSASVIVWAVIIELLKIAEMIRDIRNRLLKEKDLRK